MLNRIPDFSPNRIPLFLCVYKFQVKATAKGNTNYKAGSKVVTVKVVVK